MSTTRPLPRSNYADKLREFSECVFTQEHAFEAREQWREFFQARIGAKFDGRVILELGCSDGTLLTTVAARHLETAFVGLDWKCKPLHDCASRVASEKLRNIVLLRARGQDVARIFGAEEVHEIWLFHPDPCDTPVELKNRLMGEGFLADAHRVLRDSGIVVLKTDHAEYYQWTLDHCCRRLFNVSMTSSDYWADKAALMHTGGRLFSGLTTPFEAKFLKKRQPIYYVEIRKESKDEKSRSR
jgi:tRNA (guanine-N7-)-methyltransferase